MIKDPLTGEVIESEHVDLNEEMDRTMVLSNSYYFLFPSCPMIDKLQDKTLFLYGKYQGVALVHKFYDKKKKPTLRERLELQRKERLASGYGKRKKELSDIDVRITNYLYFILY